MTNDVDLQTLQATAKVLNKQLCYVHKMKPRLVVKLLEVTSIKAQQNLAGLIQYHEVYSLEKKK